MEIITLLKLNYLKIIGGKGLCPPDFCQVKIFFSNDYFSFNFSRMNQSISFNKSMEWIENRMNISLYKWHSLI